MGQSMGVTSTGENQQRGLASDAIRRHVLGLLLLRMVDPDNVTPALTAFSYKQLLHEPIVGGGLWTASVLPFLASAGLWPGALPVLALRALPDDVTVQLWVCRGEPSLSGS